MSRYSKAIWALLGTITPTAVMVVLGLVHVHVPAATAAGICTVCGVVATILAPANATKPTVPPVP